MIFGDIDQRAVWIGKLERTVRTPGKQIASRHGLRVEVARLRSDLEILLLDFGQVVFESVQARHAEPDMVHCRLLDTGAVECRNLPWQDCKRHPTIRQMVAAALARHISSFELED